MDLDLSDIDLVLLDELYTIFMVVSVIVFFFYWAVVEMQ